MSVVDASFRAGTLGQEASPRRIAPAEAAWIALLPCAALAVLAVVVLGPPLGHLLYAPGADRLWPLDWWESVGQPEPAKQGRYLIAMLAPLLLVGAVVGSARVELKLRSRTIQVAAWTGSAALAALAVVALLHQRALIVGRHVAPPIFGPVAVAAAAALVLAAVLALPRTPLATRIARLTADTPARRAVALAAAAAFAAAWLLKGLMTDRLGIDTVGFNFPFTFNDALAVLDGRTPLVDYHVIYAKLLPYATSVVLSAFGANVLVYTAFMAALNGLALLAVYAVFRRVTRSALLGLALFLPFVAVSDVNCAHTQAGLVSSLTLSAMWPMRYGGVWLLAWLTARQLDGRRPLRAWPLFLVAGLVAINSIEFGAPALVASAAALACVRPPHSRAAALRLAGEVAVGLLGAVAAVCVLSLARAGALPRPGMLLEWPRIFSRLGWFSLPMPVLGFHLAIYATFAAAFVLAAVRALRPEERDLLTGMLLWSGAFGLLAGSYYVGRPDALKLEGILSAWSFALTMLTVAAVRAWAARGWRRPSVPQLLVLLGFALSLTALARISPPWTQVARLTKARPAPVYERAAERFVGAHTRHGETVAILLPMSYRIAVSLGLRNVAPYGYSNELVTRSQLETLIGALRRDDVRKLFVPYPGSFLEYEGDSSIAQLHELVVAGWRATSASREGIVELTRRR